MTMPRAPVPPPDVTFGAITPFTAARYAPFTFRDQRLALERFDRESPLTAVGADVGAEPAGLAVASGKPGPDPCRLVSLFVVPALRGRGVGAALLERLEAALAARGYQTVEVSYAVHTPGTPALERVLDKCGWAQSAMQLHVLTLDGRIMTAPWFDEAVLPSDYAIAPWSTVTPAERAALSQSQERERWIPEYLVPFRFDDRLEIVNSLVLRHQATIVGWLLTRRIDDSAIHYLNLHVKPSVNRTGRTFASLALLAEAVRRQARALGVASRGRFEVAGQNVAFLRFLDHHVAPYLLSHTVLQRRVKRLREPGTVTAGP